MCSQKNDASIPADYGGKILTGDYSQELKQRISQSILQFRDIDGFGLSFFYVAAWHRKEKIIWYEYMSAVLLSLFSCDCEEAAERFRALVCDQRTYSCRSGDIEVEEEILSSGMLQETGEDIRRKRVHSGRMEAIYQMDLAEIHWLKDSSVLETWRDDDICLSFGCLVDVSKEMEQKDQLFQENVIVNRDKSILVRVERTDALDSMTTRLCHEIRNPIVSMGGLVKRLLKQSAADQKMAQYLQVIDQEVSRLEKILIGFSEYNRPLQLGRETVTAKELVGSVLGLLKTEMRQLQIKPLLYCPDGLPELFVDRKLLEEALLHILKNSIESLPDGGDIECSVKQGEDHLRLTIQDQGVGIKDHLKHKIFEPFFTTKIYGAGLGLTMADKAITLHGGTLEILSSQEGGTRVIVELPYCEHGNKQCKQDQ